MRRLLMFAVPLLVVGSFGIADAARNAPFAKTAVCDLTSSKTKPYHRVIAATRVQLKQYSAKPEEYILKHRDDYRNAFGSIAGR